MNRRDWTIVGAIMFVIAALCVLPEPIIVVNSVFMFMAIIGIVSATIYMAPTIVKLLAGAWDVMHGNWSNSKNVLGKANALSIPLTFVFVLATVAFWAAHGAVIRNWFGIVATAMGVAIIVAYMTAAFWGHLYEVSKKWAGEWAVLIYALVYLLATFAGASAFGALYTLPPHYVTTFYTFLGGSALVVLLFSGFIALWSHAIAPGYDRYLDRYGQEIGKDGEPVVRLFLLTAFFLLTAALAFAWFGLTASHSTIVLLNLRWSWGMLLATALVVLFAHSSMTTKSPAETAMGLMTVMYFENGVDKIRVRWTAMALLIIIVVLSICVYAPIDWAWFLSN